MYLFRALQATLKPKITYSLDFEKEKIYQSISRETKILEEPILISAVFIGSSKDEEIIVLIDGCKNRNSIIVNPKAPFTKQHLMVNLSVITFYNQSSSNEVFMRIIPCFLRPGEDPKL